MITEDEFTSVSKLSSELKTINSKLRTELLDENVFHTLQRYWLETWIKYERVAWKQTDMWFK